MNFSRRSFFSKLAALVAAPAAALAAVIRPSPTPEQVMIPMLKHTTLGLAYTGTNEAGDHAFVSEVNFSPYRLGFRFNEIEDEPEIVDRMILDVGDSLRDLYCRKAFAQFKHWKDTHR